MTPIEWRWLGRQPYGPVLERQRSHREAVIASGEGDALWLLEHEPTITTGRRPVDDLPNESELEARGIHLFRTERGGLATYHGPGQLVAYAIVDCWERGLGAKGAVTSMEQGIIDWLSEEGVQSERRTGFPGIWVGADKIAAVGMHFKKGVSMHGVAINLAKDLSGFNLITPCGITDGGVTSLEDQVGAALPVAEAASRLAPHLLHNLHDPPCNRSCETGAA